MHTCVMCHDVKIKCTRTSPSSPAPTSPPTCKTTGRFPPSPTTSPSGASRASSKHSSLNRTATEADLVDALDLLGRALRQLSENPPLVFVLENTHSLLSGPRFKMVNV